MLFARKNSDAPLLSSSVFFDDQYVRESIPVPQDVPAAEFYLAHREHWIKSPSRFFDAGFYTEAHEDVRKSNFPPIIHYLKYGWKEARLPHPEFDRQAFLNAHPSVNSSKIDPAQACILMYGGYTWKETRRTAKQTVMLEEVAVDHPAPRVDLSEPAAPQPGDQASALATPFVERSDQVALTVVIPSYNRAELIRETATQLLSAAGNDPVEILVVDDGSTDETPDVLRLLKFHHKNFRFERTKNRGPGPARNHGAAAAKGDVVLFLGDDTRPVTSDLFRAHYAVHKNNKSKGFFGLGKVVWPDDRFALPNFVMSLIQGDGQQQFGYKFMKPWQRYAPWLFYTANASLKADVVSDWEAEGFSDKFTLYGFEDGEFAYRMSKKFEDFGVYYVPNAVVNHHHHYDVAGFMKRQVSCGFMMDVLFKIHPNLKETILDPKLLDIFNTPAVLVPDDSLGLASHYSTVIEGIKSWAIILDKHHGLGSQNWHQDFLSAVFQLAFLESYVMLQVVSPSAQVRAYRYLLDDFKLRLTRAVETEVLGDLPNFTFF
ncbi:glycosyltransferase family 2 protein [Agrobacterium vitis]